MAYRSSKTYGHEAGLTACFRQWRAQSHCRFLHGYALSIHVEFEATELDERNWVVDFGSLKSFNGMLGNTFDHKTLVAEDDPMLMQFHEMEAAGIAEIIIVEATGCEAFAKLVWEYAEVWLKDNGYAPRVRCHHVTVKEHTSNSASFFAPLTVEDIAQ